MQVQKEDTYKKLSDEAKYYQCENTLDHLFTGKGYENGIGRVSGGDQVETREEWPFIANMHNYCAATLVSRQFALTSGTCCAQPLNR